MFNATASAFTITSVSGGEFSNVLTLSGIGVTNNSGIIQNFVAECGDGAGLIQFTNSATAGELTVFSATPGPFQGGSGAIDFLDNSTASSATLIANRDDRVSFGGAVYFENDSTGETARVEVFGNGLLLISFHNPPGVTIGSIEGDGLVFLGAQNLTTGSNNLSTTFSGVIQDGGPFGGDGPGSLTKDGTGKLILRNANTYTGGTVVEEGVLVVNNRTGSVPAVVLCRFTAAHSQAGAQLLVRFVVGTGAGIEAVLSPGKGSRKPRTLNIQGTIVFNSDATYKVDLDSLHAAADKVVANGVTIDVSVFLFL